MRDSTLVRKHMGRLAIAALTAAVVATSGCSLVNPHISIPPPDTVAVPINLPPDQLRSEKIKFYGDLPLYIDYANEMRDEYYAAVGHQSLLRNGTALTLIPLAATALYLGIVGDAGTNTMAALGVGGAAGWGVSSFLESRPRQGVYLAGADAIGCAVLSVTPWLVTQVDYNDLNAALFRLPVASAKVRTAADEVYVLAAGYEAGGIVDPRIKVALQRAEQARQRITEAEAARGRGLALRKELQTAQIRLYNQLMTIRNEVSKQVVRTEPQLDEILGFIGSLAASSSIFAPTPLPPVEPAADALTAQSTAGGAPPVLSAAQAARLTAAEDALVASLAELAPDVVTVTNLVDQSDVARKQVTSLDACVPEDLVLPMEILPQYPITFFEGQDDSSAVFVKFGKKPFVPRILGATASEDSGLTVESPRDLGPDLVIRAKKPARGAYTLLVTDAEGSTATKAINVTAGPLKRGTPFNPDKPKCPNVDGEIITDHPLTDFEKCKPRSVGKQLQRALCLRNKDGSFNQPGNLGPATRLAICQWRRDTGKSCSGPNAAGLTEQEYNDITAGGDCQTARRSWLENKRLMDHTVATLERVGVDVSGFKVSGLTAAQEETLFQTLLADSAVRARIARFSKLKDLKPVLERNPETGATNTREVISKDMLDAIAQHPNITAADIKKAQQAMCVTESGTADAATQAAVKQLHADTGQGNDAGKVDWDVLLFLADKPKCADGLMSYYENADHSRVELVLKEAGVVPPKISELSGANAAATRAKVKTLKTTKATPANGIDASSALITKKLVKAI